MGKFKLNEDTSADYLGDGIWHIWQSDGQGGHEFVVFTMRDAELMQELIESMQFKKVA